ncbi:MAG: hypothetical protein P9M14_01320 [Candidatus Alcyoniella australis]|nr:hypothetical protein [Candidatus Alcyoniella australis]
MTVFGPHGSELYRIDCPSFRLKKNVYVYQGGEKGKQLFFISPVYGIDWNMMVCTPDDQIIGVLQYRRGDSGKGPKCWYFIDADGRERMCVNPELSSMQRVRRWFSLLSFHRYQVLVNGEVAAIFEKHSGLVHGHYEIDLLSSSLKEQDVHGLLATCIALSGIFRMVFTRFS